MNDKEKNILKNHVDPVRNTIIRLVENPEESGKLRKAAREFAVKELDRKKILSQFTESLKTL